jgi:hypothetical protein
VSIWAEEAGSKDGRGREAPPKLAEADERLEAGTVASSGSVAAAEGGSGSMVAAGGRRRRAIVVVVGAGAAEVGRRERVEAGIVGRKAVDGRGGRVIVVGNGRGGRAARSVVSVATAVAPAEVGRERVVEAGIVRASSAGASLSGTSRTPSSKKGRRSGARRTECRWKVV